HEKISVLFVERLNTVFGGALDTALKIFTNQYPRNFFYQLVSSQLDIDRLDYLKRDSYFTGVSEGHIGSERIINMLNVKNDEIVVEEKGIYSIENFLSARRLMYWQVYLHKTAVSAEEMLIKLIQRAKYLTQNGVNVPATPALKILLERNIALKHFEEDSEILDLFALLDDSDIWGSMKFWREHEDIILSGLSTKLLERRIFKIILANEKPLSEWVDALKSKVQDKYQLNSDEIDYYTGSGQISNSAYISSGQKIKILTKKGSTVDIVKATDLPNVKAMSKIVTKHFFCWPEVD
ncbi:MAG: phosphohydrolase, partial [Reichenbachiella sp.]